MLSELRIRNFALVEDATLNFEEGMTAFTGETGAGKSLLLDAITLLLGAKARSDLVRSGSKIAEVEGVFDLSKDPAKRKLAQQAGVALEEDEGYRLLVRREISAEDMGRNRVWIQGRASTRGQLQELLGDWVEVSGQHEFLKLNREEFVLATLDQFAGLRAEVATYGEHYTQYQDTLAHYENFARAESTRQSKLDFLRFQIDELERAGITHESSQEEERLVMLRARLGSVEKISQACATSQALLETSFDGEGPAQLGIVTQVQTLSRELRPFAALDEEFGRLLESVDRLQDSALEVKELVDEIFTSLEADPEALENAESRLSLLNRLKRKYNTDTAGLSLLLESSRDEWEKLNGGQSDPEELKKILEKKAEQVRRKARTLHEKRVEAAKLLQKAWQKDLAALGMKQAQLRIELDIAETLRPSGVTLAHALFSANPGETLRPLGKVASGGELSRLLLSLKNIVSGRAEVGVYLFDEVDAGIGGETAHAVGARLRSIAQDNQVLVVTHLAQVAASGHQQFRIEKRFEKDRVRTYIDVLSRKERTLEIARMLGMSNSRSAQSLAHELLEVHS